MSAQSWTNNNNNNTNMHIAHTHFNTKHSLRLPTRHLTGIIMLFLLFLTQFTYTKSHEHWSRHKAQALIHSSNRSVARMLARQTVIYNICTKDNLKSERERGSLNFYVSTLDLLCKSFCSLKSQSKYKCVVCTLLLGSIFVQSGETIIICVHTT